MRRAAIIGCTAGIWLSGCTDDGLVDGLFTDGEWRTVESFTPLPPIPPSLTNRYADDDLAAAFGQMMFFEKRYSGMITVDDPSAEGRVGDTGKYSCASCHDSKNWFIDTRSKPGSVSVGAAQVTKRNSPSMVNIAYYEWGGWAGAQDQFWKQGANSPETKDLNGDRLGIAHMIWNYYRDEYNAAFDPDLDPDLDPLSPNQERFPAFGKPGVSAWDLMPVEDQRIINTILANVGKAFEAYERRLTSGDAPFDRYVAGDFDAISSSARRGLKLFIGKAGCDSCHTDETFTDQGFHNTAVALPVGVSDLGRYEDFTKLDNPFNGRGEFSDDIATGTQKLNGLVRTDDMKGQYRTKSLRQIAFTGPYFHDGSAPTLEAVVRHYNQGGAPAGYPGTKDTLMVPLNLSETEILDIVAFLQTLTGKPVAEELTIDTSKR